MNTAFDSQHSSLGDYGQESLEANPFAEEIDTAKVPSSSSSSSSVSPVLDNDENIVVASPISNVNKQLESIDLNNSEDHTEQHQQEDPNLEYTSSQQEETDTQVCII